MKMKSYPIPNKLNHFFVFGSESTSIMAIRDNNIYEETNQRRTHEWDEFYDSDPVLLENGTLGILGRNHILIYKMEENLCF